MVEDSESSRKIPGLAASSLWQPTATRSTGIFCTLWWEASRQPHAPPNLGQVILLLLRSSPVSVDQMYMGRDYELGAKRSRRTLTRAYMGTNAAETWHGSPTPLNVFRQAERMAEV